MQVVRCSYLFGLHRLGPKPYTLNGLSFFTPPPCRLTPMFRSSPLLLLGLLLWLGMMPLATAQDTFDIVPSTTNPTPGAAEVPLGETILFEYNQPLNVNTENWNVAFVEPRGQITTTNTQLCVGPEPCGEAVDDPGQQRFVRYVVNHEPDTDYTWIVYTTRNTELETMATPFVLRYTTAATMGQRSISGSVGTLAGQDQLMSDTPQATQEVLWGLLDALEQQGMGQLEARATPQRATGDRQRPDTRAAQPPMAANTSGDGHTIIYLLEDFSVQGADWQIKGADVITGRSGAYEADFLRDGTYWPLAVRYTDRERLAIEGIGFYDATGNRMPDSVQVAGASPADIDLLMFDFPLVTARTNLGVARTFAERQLAAPELKRVEALQGSRTSGQAYTWRYTYSAASDDAFTQVTVDPFGVQATPPGSSSAFAAREEVPRAFVDSDEALQTTLDDGGQAFINERSFRPQNLTVSINGSEHLNVADAPAGTNWRVRITGRTTRGTTTFERYVDMATGAVVGGTPALVAATRSRGAPPRVRHYPNPARESVTFHLHLEAPAAATLRVYDVQGREVAHVLEDTPLSAGTHHIPWTPTPLANGVYLYRLHLDGETYSDRLILQR